jgi:hypothetical protein
LIFSPILYAQDQESKTKVSYDFNGYIKYMNTSMFINNGVEFDNLIHNRLNFKTYFNDNLTFAIELRNRAFWGYSVKNIPGFDDLVDGDNNQIDMSFNLINSDDFLLQIKVDRLYFIYNTGNWEFEVGRQRINWGKNLVWNPNDLFNAFNFFDFDYEERPGSDAIRIQYNTSKFSNIEVAYSYGEDFDHSVLAAKYLFNYKEYEIQFIGGNFKTDIAIGTGWEGNIKNSGFKGEITYFIPKYKTEFDKNALSMSLSSDYYFSNGLSIMGSFLYNSRGVSSIEELKTSLIPFEELSAKNLMPNKYSLFAQVGKMISPALNTSFSTIYVIGLETVFIMPDISYSINDKFDLDFIGQLYLGSLNYEFDSVFNSLFLRFRYSF